MSSESHYFCPACQGPELRVQRPVLAGTGSGSAECLLCGWKGSPEDLIAPLAVEARDFWTIDRVANVLLHVAARHASAPLLGTLEALGLAPRATGASDEEMRSALAVREAIVKCVLESVVRAAFEAAGEHAQPHFERFKPQHAASVERVFSLSGDGHVDA
jgi:hypothetical protein